MSTQAEQTLPQAELDAQLDARADHVADTAWPHLHGPAREDVWATSRRALAIDDAARAATGHPDPRTLDDRDDCALLFAQMLTDKGHPAAARLVAAMTERDAHGHPRVEPPTGVLTLPVSKPRRPGTGS